MQLDNSVEEMKENHQSLIEAVQTLTLDKGQISNKVSQLQEENNRLQDEARKISVRLDCIVKEKESYEEKMSYEREARLPLLEENETLHRELSAAHEETILLKNKNLQFEKVTEMLTNENGELQNANDCLQHQIAELQEVLKEQEQMLREKQETIARQMEMAQEANDVHFQEKVMNENLIHGINKERDCIKETLTRVQDDICILSNEKEACVNTINELEKDKAKLHTDLKSALLKQDRNTAEYERQINELCFERDQHKLELETLNQKFLEVNTRMASVVNENRLSVDKMTNEREAQRLLHLEEIKLLQKEAGEDKIILLKEKTLEHDTLTDKFNGENNRLKATIEQLQEDLRELENKLEHQKHLLTGEIETLAEQMKISQEKCYVLSQEKTAIEKGIDDVTKERDCMKQDVTKLQDDVCTLSSEKEAYEHIIKELEQTKTKLQAQFDGLLLQQEQTTSEHEKKLTELYVERDQQKAHLGKLYEDISHMKQEIENLCETTDTLQKQKSILEENMKTAKHENMCLQEETLNFRESQKELLLQIESTQKDKVEYIFEAQSEIESLQNARDALVEKCQHLEQNMMQFREENERITDQRNEITEKMASLAIELKNISSDKEAMAEEYEREVSILKQEKCKLATEKDKLLKEICELHTANESLCSSSSAMKADVQFLVVEIQNMELNNDVMQKENIQLKQDNQKLMQEIEEINTRISGVVAENELRVEKMGHDIERQRYLHAEEIERIKKELESTQKEYAFLLKEKKMELGTVSGTLTTVNERLNKIKDTLQLELLQLREKMEAEKEVLQREKETLTKQMGIVQEENAILLHKKTVSDSIIQDMSKEWDSLKEDLTMLRGAVDSLTNEMYMCLYWLKELEESRSQIQADLEIARLEQGEMTTEYKRQLNELCHVRDRQTLELERMDGDLVCVEKENKTLHKMVDGLEQQVAEFQEEISKALHERTCLQEETLILQESQKQLLLQIELLQKDKVCYISKAQSEVVSLQNERVMLVKQCQQLEKQAVKYKEEKERVTEERNEIVVKMDVLATELDRVSSVEQQKAKEYEVTIHALEQDKCRRDAENQKHKNDINDLQAKNERLCNSNDEINADLQFLLEELERTREEMVKEKTAENNKITCALTAENNKLQTANDQLQYELLAISKRMEEENESLKREKDTLVKQIEMTKEECDILLQEKSASENIIDGITKERNKMKEEINEHQTTNKKLANSCDAMKEDIQFLIDEIQKLELRTDQASRDSSHLRQENHKLQEEIEQVNIRMDSAIKDNGIKMEKLVSEIEEERILHSTEVERMHKKMSMIHEENEVLWQEKRVNGEIISNITKDKNNLETESKKIHKEMDELQTTNTKLVSTCDMLEDDLHFLVEEVQTLELYKDQVSNENVQLQQKNDTLQQESEETQTRMTSIAKENELKIQKLLNEIQKERMLHSEEIVTIQKELLSVQEEKAVLLKNSTIEHEVTDTLNSEKDNLHRTNEKLTEKLTELTKRLEEEEQSSILEKERLVKQITVKQEKCDILLREKKGYEKIIDGITKEKNKIQGETNEPRDTNKTLIRSYDTMKEDAQFLIDEIQKLELSKEQLSEDSSRFQQENQRLQEEIKGMNIKIDGIFKANELKMEVMSKELEKEGILRSEDVDRIEKELVLAQAKNAVLMQEKNLELGQVAVTLTNEISELRTAKSQLQGELAMVTETLGNMAKEHETAVQMISLQRGEEQSAYVRERRTVEEHVASLQEAVETSELLIPQLKLENEDLSEKLTQQQTVNMEVKKNYGMLMKEMDRLNQELYKARSSIEDLKKERKLWKKLGFLHEANRLRLEKEELRSQHLREIQTIKKQSLVEKEEAKKLIRMEVVELKEKHSEEREELIRTFQIEKVGNTLTMYSWL